jgi:hypothetical protein
VRPVLEQAVDLADRCSDPSPQLFVGGPEAIMVTPVDSRHCRARSRNLDARQGLLDAAKGGEGALVGHRHDIAKAGRRANPKPGHG